MSKPTRLTLPVVPACRDAETPHEPEFAPGLSTWDNRLSRRGLLQMAAASSIAALAAGGCNDRPDEPIVPYVDPPEQVVAGEPQFFATTLTRNGYGRGVIVTSREGRPVKIEGNPDHPASLGAADAQMQAAVLDLYDPLRSNQVTEAGVASTWGEFVRALRERVAQAKPNSGEIAVLIDPTGSPTIDDLMITDMPARWFTFEPTGGGPIRHVGLSPAKSPHFNDSEWVYDLTTADVIVSFDADFLHDSPGSLAYARQFADRRRIVPGRPGMNRLYVAEADVSITGTKADHRLAVRPSRVGVLLAALVAQFEANGHTPRDLTAPEAAWLSAIATDLNITRGRSAVVVGNHYPPALHVLAERVNAHFGNIGKTVRRQHAYVRRPSHTNGIAGLQTLVDEMNSGTIRTLLILADNPARTAPADIPFAAALAAMTRREGTFTAHLGLYANETAYACCWHVPALHELEQWGDAIAFDGTASLLQPLIAPLANGHSVIDVLNVLAGSSRSAYDTVREMWRYYANAENEAAFEGWWQNALRTGMVPRNADSNGYGASIAPDLPEYSSAGIDIALRPDYAIGDGSLFHNPWLQELPRPMTKIVWGNAALVSPATAARLDLADEDLVTLEADGRKVDTPVIVVPGIADDTAVLHLGYGEHRLYGADAAWAASNVPRGVDAYPLRTSRSPGFVANAKLVKTGRKQTVVRTHSHHAMAADTANDPSVRHSLTPQVVATPRTPHDELKLHHRKLIRTATLAEYFKKPDFAAKMDEHDIHQLYPSWDYSHGPQWGMTIDLTACIGCNACVVACQAENNIPSVGPEQVAKQREMHWLRVDSYLDGAGHVHHQPVPCMHCENAPCEYVCPVAATTHSVDGLNQMTYNRCVGTRYCSNNCPYKVRRFNFLNYTFYQPESHKMQRNPDVTVRTRGVMEKCTYCVQRLVYADRKTEIAAVDAGDRADDVRRNLFRRIQTACQQTCPTRAIHFGDLTDADTEVAKSKHSPLNYGLLTELSTKPRTTYLASITNPSPAMEPAS